jgi:hypothetical protein
MQKRTKAAIAAAASILLLGGGVAAYAASDGYDAKLQQRHEGPHASKLAINANDTDSHFVSLAPCRAADTRGGGGSIATGAERAFQITGTTGFTSQGGSVAGGCNVPSSATAVVLNVTAIAGNGAGFITVYPTGENRPSASSLNLTPNQVIPNAVTAKLGSGGKVTGYNGSGGAVNLVVDVAGYYTQAMFAVVADDGSLYVGHHTSAASSTSTGSYTVTFDREMDGCAVNVTPEDPSVHASAFPSGTTVFVQTRNTSGTLENHWFDLTVTC